MPASFKACYAMVAGLPLKYPAGGPFQYGLQNFITIFQDRFVNEKLGSAQARINLSDLRKFAFPIPPIDEMNVLINLIHESFGKCITLKNGVEYSGNRLTQLNQSILSKAFRGELVPQDPNDEIASVLLERIRATREKQEAEKKATKKKKAKKKTSKKASKKKVSKKKVRRKCKKPKE